MMKITIEGSPEELEAMLRKLEGTTPALRGLDSGGWVRHLQPWDLPVSPTTVTGPADDWRPSHVAYSPPNYIPVTCGMGVYGLVDTGRESIY